MSAIQESRCPVLNVPFAGRTFGDVTPFRLGAALERAALWDCATTRPALSI